MVGQPLPYVTADEYLRFERDAEFRSEYVDGQVVPVTGGTADHSLITANTIFSLKTVLAKKTCRVFDSSLMVMLRRESSYAYPDVTVVCGKPEFLSPTSETLVNPKVIVEVLSPTTRNYDLGDKARLYWQLPSLAGLLLVDQDRVWIEYWSREPGGKWERDVITDLADVVKIRALECELPVSEIYAQVELGDEEA